MLGPYLIAKHCSGDEDEDENGGGEVSSDSSGGIWCDEGEKGKFSNDCGGGWGNGPLAGGLYDNGKGGACMCNYCGNDPSSTDDEDVPGGTCGLCGNGVYFNKETGEGYPG